MAKNRASLGLHTKPEREKAYTEAFARYQYAINHIADNPAYLHFAEGYIQAIRDMAKTESSDRDFIDALEYLITDLQERGSGS